MSIFDMLLANAMGESGGGGGGGSSDFSTAEVTVIDGADWLSLAVPCLLNNIAAPFHSAGSSFTAILYKGVAVMPANEYIASVSGNITFDEDEEVYFITGDCTITISA